MNVVSLERPVRAGRHARSRIRTPPSPNPGRAVPPRCPTRCPAAGASDPARARPARTPHQSRRHTSPPCPTVDQELADLRAVVAVGTRLERQHHRTHDLSRVLPRDPGAEAGRSQRGAPPLRGLGPARGRARYPTLAPSATQSTSTSARSATAASTLVRLEASDAHPDTLANASPRPVSRSLPAISAVRSGGRPDRGYAKRPQQVVRHRPRPRRPADPADAFDAGRAAHPRVRAGRLGGGMARDQARQVAGDVRRPLLRPAARSRPATSVTPVRTSRLSSPAATAPAMSVSSRSPTTSARRSSRPPAASSSIRGTGLPATMSGSRPLTAGEPRDEGAVARRHPPRRSGSVRSTLVATQGHPGREGVGTLGELPARTAREPALDARRPARPRRT